MKKVLILCLSLLFSFGARAEDKSELLTAKKVYQLEPIIVTATRYPEHLKNVPANATLLSSFKLRKFNFLSLGELLKDFSAGDMKSSECLGQVQTFSLRGSSSSQVLFLLEGRKLNYLSNGIFNLSDLSLVNLEKVEIVRGPLSSLYGANALGGVVNLIPSLPLKRNLSSSIMYGDENTFVTNLDFSSGIKRLRLDSGLERKQTKGDRENSDYSALFFHSTLFYPFTSDADLKLYLSTQNDDMGIPGPVPDPLNIPKFGNSSVSSLFDHQKDKNVSFDLKFNHRFSKESSDTKSSSREFTARLFYDHRRMNYFTRYDFLGEVDEDYSYLTKSLGGFLQYSFKIKKENRVTLGLDFSKDQLDAQEKSMSVTSQTSSSLSWNPESNTMGLWGNSSWNVRKFTFQLGSRYDIPSDFEKVFSPNLGLIYHLDGDLSLKLNYGKAYRAPTFNDLYWPDGGKKDLKPEKGESVEAGLAFTDKKISYQLFLFRREVKNLISWQPLGENGLWQPFNLDRFNCRGVELELEYMLSDGYNFSLNYSYTRGEEIKKDLVYEDYFSGERRFEEMKRRARFQPENVFNLNCNAKIFPSFSAELTFNYRSRRLNYYPDYSDYPEIKYVTKKIRPCANFDINLNQKVKSLTFFLKINNLLDDKTPTQFGNSISDLDYPNPGRRIFAGMKLNITD
jgi:outer membrane cobalamin receptor